MNPFSLKTSTNSGKTFACRHAMLIMGMLTSVGWLSDRRARRAGPHPAAGAVALQRRQRPAARRKRRRGQGRAPEEHRACAPLCGRASSLPGCRHAAVRDPGLSWRSTTGSCGPTRTIRCTFISTPACAPTRRSSRTSSPRRSGWTMTSPGAGLAWGTSPCGMRRLRRP